MINFTGFLYLAGGILSLFYLGYRLVLNEEDERRNVGTALDLMVFICLWFVFWPLVAVFVYQDWNERRK